MAKSLHTDIKFWWIYIEEASLHWNDIIIEEHEPLLLYALD
jgi:hypothetical protein